MSIGKAIRLCRTACGLTQLELAQRCELSVSYLSLLEREKRDPALSTVEAIAKALGVSLVLLTFLAASDSEVSSLGSELREKLSYAWLRYFEKQREVKV